MSFLDYAWAAFLGLMLAIAWLGFGAIVGLTLGAIIRNADRPQSKPHRRSPSALGDQDELRSFHAEDYR